MHTDSILKKNMDSVPKERIGSVLKEHIYSVFKMRTDSVWKENIEAVIKEHIDFRRAMNMHLKGHAKPAPHSTTSWVLKAIFVWFVESSHSYEHMKSSQIKHNAHLWGGNMLGCLQHICTYTGIIIAHFSM